MSGFEEWAYKNGLSRIKDDVGYFSKSTQAGHDAWQEQQKKIDELEKRINKAVEHIEDYYGVVELSTVVDILNGELK